MSGKLVFTADDQEMMLEAARLEARGFARTQDIREMLAYIRDGGTAVASMHKFNMGFSLPAGATVEFTEACERGTAARTQAEGRVRPAPGEVKLRPHQERIFKAVMEMDPKELSERLVGVGRRRIHPMPEIDMEQAKSRIHRTGQKPVNVVVLGECHNLDKLHELRDAEKIIKQVKGIKPVKMKQPDAYGPRVDLAHSDTTSDLQDLGRVPRPAPKDPFAEPVDVEFNLPDDEPE